MRSKRNSATKNVVGCHKVSPLLAIVYCDIEDLKTNPHNPRLHSKKQVRQIAESIKILGFNVPVLVDRNQQLIAGHGRVEALRLLGIPRVPTIRLEHLSEPQIRAFMIADNRLAENATWDDRLLAEQFQFLSEVDLDFDLEATGFEIAEIDLIIEELTPGPTGDSDPADEIPELDSVAQVTQAGDLWLLGLNRIVCGDALDERAYSRLMDGKLADCVFTDPPYNDPIDGYVSGFGKLHHAEFAMASGEMSKTEFTEFLRKVSSQLVGNSRSGALHYIFIDWRHVPELLAATERVYEDFKNMCVWVKDSGGQGSFYRSQHELVFVFKSGKDKHRNNIQLGQYGRYRTNVWEYPRVKSFANPTEETNLATLHPTVKPVALVADAIMDCTMRGDIVLDPFLGSGTTLMAAERVGRTCFGLELAPVFVDLAVRRWQISTGQTAIDGKTGQSFQRGRRRCVENNDDDETKDYETGYCKPPVETQFKKGQSGNPKGRPKGSLNVATAFLRAIYERVVINEGGKRKTVTKLEAAAKQLANKAASGDLGASRQLFALLLSIEQQRQETSIPGNHLEEADQIVVAGLMKRWNINLEGK